MKTFLSLLMTVALTSMAFAAKEGWIDDLEKAKAQAKAEGKKILLDFTGSDWCGWCKRMDAEVFARPDVSDYMAKHFVAVRLNAESGELATWQGGNYSARRLASTFCRRYSGKTSPKLRTPGCPARWKTPSKPSKSRSSSARSSRLASG